ncbi:MAG TPA: response regulator, partial [Bacteroidales bacterium]
MVTKALPFENLNVLVVEDDDASFLLLEEFLCDYKLHLIHACNGEEALSHIVSGTPLHLAIIDVRLPHETDGLQLAVRIRERRPGLGIIIQTATILSVLQRLTLMNLDCDYFTKPLDLDRFCKSVCRNLERSL